MHVHPQNEIDKSVSLYDSIETGTQNIELDVIETTQEFNDKGIRRYMYTEKDHTNYPAGKPIVVKKGSELNIAVNNSTSVDTNIHWHGLSLSNDRDGPHFLIDKDGGEFDYSFTPDYSGSYWYHSHNRSVRDQVDFGMFVPMIILDETDEQYTLDRIMMIDYWAVSPNTGHMQVEGMWIPSQN